MASPPWHGLHGGHARMIIATYTTAFIAVTVSTRWLSKTISAGAGALLIATVYVAALYVWKQDCDPDGPQGCRRRIASSCAATAASLAFTYNWLETMGTEPHTGTELMGIAWHQNTSPYVLAPLLSAVILFMGPLALEWHEDGIGLRIGEMTWYDWKCWVAAPITEELSYRSALLPLVWHVTGSQHATVAVILAPLLFGLAHVHHIYKRITQMGHSAKQALLGALLQLSYTWIFGIFTTIVLYRTQSVVAAILPHVFCNIMGLPSVPDGSHPSHVKVLYVAGLALFIVNVNYLTAPFPR